MEGLSCTYVNDAGVAVGPVVSTTVGQERCADNSEPASDMTPYSVVCTGTPQNAAVKFVTSLTGVTAATFNRGVFKSAVAATAGNSVSAADVAINSVEDVTSRRRRRLLATGVKVDYAVENLSTAEAGLVITAVDTAVEDGVLIDEIQTAATAEGDTAMAAVSESTMVTPSTIEEATLPPSSAGRHLVGFWTSLALFFAVVCQLTY